MSGTIARDPAGGSFRSEAQARPQRPIAKPVRLSAVCSAADPAATLTLHDARHHAGLTFSQFWLNVRSPVSSRPAKSPGGFSEASPHAGPRPERVIDDRDELAWLMAELTDRERECLVQKVVYNRSGREIGEMIGLSLGQANLIVRTATQKLREFARGGVVRGFVRVA